ncbi:MAG: hypothetical protein K8U57_27775 [Planctomycetes bacterium]|nr:hypothetical protein [Planctomycetota bacterium]
MSFLFPNTISISRQNSSAAVGSQPYGGVTRANETVIASGIAANVYVDRQGTSPVAKLPADAAGQSTWKIVFRGPKGLAQSRDIITDELGRRFQVTAPDWGPLVTTCRAQILEV